MYKSIDKSGKLRTIVGIGTLAAALASVSAVSSDEAADYTKMTPEEAAEYMIFESGSFNLSQEMQEGGTGRDRMMQDDLQKACSVIGGGKPDADTLAQISKTARESIKYPEGGIKLGDWQKGYELAWSGFGFRVGHNYDDHETREPGGNCYNCHKLAPQREIASGTIGPRLTGFAKDRGTDEATVKYVYEMIYNPHAYFPCTYMPRFGYKKLLTQEQISHLMAYILDPESPVNQ